jgi:hypothetical protein
LAEPDAMTETTPSPAGRGLRVVVLVLAGVETGLFVLVELLLLSALLSSGEQMGRSIAGALAAALLIPFLLLTLPALILAIRGRWLKLALVLAILALALPLLVRGLT